VDEIPEVLAKQFSDGGLCFIPLPSLEDALINDNQN
jgi:hypothetical protein